MTAADPAPLRRLISSGSAFEAAYGYSRAVIDGEWIFVSGTTGFDYAAGTIAEDAADQARQALRTIAAVLAEAGAGLADVVRARYCIAQPADAEPVLRVIGEHFAAIRPAATAIICGLIDPRMKVEIEVTARRRAAPAGPEPGPAGPGQQQASTAPTAPEEQPCPAS